MPTYARQIEHTSAQARADALVAMLDEGVRALNVGKFVEVEVDQLDTFLDSLVDEDAV